MLFPSSYIFVSKLQRVNTCATFIFLIYFRNVDIYIQYRQDEALELTVSSLLRIELTTRNWGRP